MFLFPLLVEKFDEVAFLRVVWIGSLTGSRICTLLLVLPVFIKLFLVFLKPVD